MADNLDYSAVRAFLIEKGARKRIRVNNVQKKRKLVREFATLHRMLINRITKCLEYYKMSQYSFSVL